MPVIDHTRYQSKQEWLDAYPEWSISGITRFLTQRLQQATQLQQYLVGSYLLSSTFGPFILAWFFPSLVSPLIALAAVFVVYYFVVPLYFPDYELESTAGSESHSKSNGQSNGTPSGKTE